MSQPPRPEPGSFKDPESCVFYLADSVVRSLSSAARLEMEEAARSGFLAELTDARLIVDTELASAASLGLQGQALGEKVLCQPRLPVVSYPYEWSFEMLRDAALLALDICTRALRRRFILKDANAFNVQWIGASPRWLDIPSLVRYREGSVRGGLRTVLPQLPVSPPPGVLSRGDPPAAAAWMARRGPGGRGGTPVLTA